MALRLKTHSLLMVLDVSNSAPLMDIMMFR
nr:MAG TPA: hypothetical protein [Caudoviricetes sp.]